MSDADDIQRVLSDFLKGKGVSPDYTSAILNMEGAADLSDLVYTPQSSDYRELAAEYPGVVAGLKRCDLMPTIAIVSAMLTLPELQGNNIRLEALAHLAIRYCRGKETPTPAKIAAWFSQLDEGTCGRREDAAETVFVVNVTDSTSNYAIFGSQDDGAAYYTQLFLDILDAMPDSGGFPQLKRSCRALLRLSDQLVARRELPRNVVGETVPQAQIPQMSKETFNYLKSVTTFSYAELDALEIHPSDLAPFTLPQEGIETIDDSFFGCSPIEAAPLIAFPKGLVVVLPTAISLAIRRTIVEFCLHYHYKDAFEQALIRATLARFSDERLFSDLPRARFFVQEREGVTFSEIFIEADEGRYLHLLFLFDDLDGYEVGGFAGMNAKDAIGKVAADRVANARLGHTKEANFREGISVIVGCGWGRGAAFDRPEDTPTWHVEFISDFDLLTFSRLPNFTSLDLFRLIRAREEVNAAGVQVFYAGSLLNLYGWVESLNGHIVRHEELSHEHFDGGREMPMMLPTSCALKPRFDAMDGFDLHLAQAPDGVLSHLQRFTSSPCLGEKALTPSYIDVDRLSQGKFRGVYETDLGQFWVDVTTFPELDPRTRYQLQKMVLNWAELIAKRVLATVSLNHPPYLMWRVEFLDTSLPETRPTQEELNSDIEFAVDPDAPIDQPRISVGKGFLALGRHPDNVAERALVGQMVRSAARALQLEDDSDDLAAVFEAIASDGGARHFHAFALSDVRDFVRGNLPESGLVIEAMDDANGRLGLGWLARARDLGGVIEGLPDCRGYLSDLVTAIATRMESHLRTLDRKETVQALILNHEAVMAELELWQRTFKAVRALSDNPNAVMKHVTDRISRLNMASLSSRIAAELALCVSPLSGGLKPGKLDVSALMADGAQLFQMGGFSDAMHAGAMKPEIHISPAGDVMMNHSFTDHIVQPMGEKFQAISLTSAAEGYKANYLPDVDDQDLPPPASHILDPDFTAAFADEFAFSVDDIRPFGEAFSDLAADRGQPILEFSYGELMEYLTTKTHLQKTVLARMLVRYTLVPREKWKSVPEGILSNAWCPWRFKRQLSLLSRPIIQIDQSEDPTLLVAPAMVVHHLSHTLNSMRKGSFDKEHFRDGGKMYKYVGTKNGKDGEAFNVLVAERVRELGWQAEPNCSDGKILGTAKRPQFGDVDVLAWSVPLGRVVALECKDLGFDKTLGEIARRLAKFRGEVKSDRRRDDLRKHLDRIEILNSHLTQLGEFVGFEPTVVESVVLTKQTGPLQVDQSLKDKGVTAIAFADLPKFLAVGET
jgi:hypothetical protein